MICQVSAASLKCDKTINTMKRILLLIQILILSNSLTMQAKTLNDSVPSGGNYDKAVFRLWYPDEYKSISGIIVIMPGSNGDGRGSVDDMLWKELSQKYHFALLGCYFTDYSHDNMVVETYANATGGSGQALLDVISLFAVKSGHSELALASLVLWGHSAGGQFNYEFACWKPERVIAFVVNKGGIYYTALAPIQTRNVPGIFFTGEKDLDSRKDIVKGIFSMNRRLGALWSFAEEPLAGHEIGQTQILAGKFFDEIIPLRIHLKTSDTESTIELNELVADSGLIGDFKAGVCYSFTDGQKIEYPAAWLPDSLFAEAWLSFIRNKPF